MDSILSILAMSAFLGVPAFLTIYNIVSLFRELKRKKLFTAITLIYGFLLSALVIGFLSEFRWDEPVILGGGFTVFHQPFCEDYFPYLSGVIIWAIISALALNSEKRFPPLAAAVFVCGMYSGMILFIFGIAQLAANIDFEVICLWVYILNYILITVRLIRRTVKIYAEHFRENRMTEGNGFRPWLCRTLSVLSGWVWFPLICVLPFTGLLICICIIFGQTPFAVIKAFTETSDWTFSTMISPPPVNYEGHYLCTVAVNGHEKLVRPTRLGIRHGVKIGVNRQLCAANAFEQLIEDKAPGFHRFVRYIYDRYGYPVSRHITTKLRADIVYIVMKPLEWIFVFSLYLFDSDPESRIAVQYTGKHIRDFSTDQKI